jgi:RNA polymerase sigma-70 factor, ECF subfamily
MSDRVAPDAWDDMMRASLAGDKAVYRSLLASITPYVRLVVRRAMRQGAGSGALDVEDIVQDVLLTVHLKRHTWDPTLPLAPWLGAVTRHKTIDAFRRSGGRVMVSIDDFAEVLAEPARAEPGLGDAERMLAALTDRDQRIVRAIKMDERSASEVGQELGMTEGAVRVALHRALKALSERFGTTRK